MNRRIAKIFVAPWYFAGFAVYPPLALIAYNINELHPAEGMRFLVISLLAGLVLFCLLWLAFRSKQRAALAVSFLLLLFYSYGHVLDLASKKMDIPRLTEWMAGLWLVLAGAAIAWLVRRRTRVRKAAPVLNLVTLGLVITSTVQIIVQSSPRSASVADDRAPVQILTIPADQAPPDIYYIIVDSYGRSDLLKRSFRIDNTEFIQRLEAMGFYIADCSQSNYNRTELSLGSSLNMDYLQNLDDEYQPTNESRGTLWDSISRGAVRADLESAGYKTIAFATGFAWSEIDDADAFLAPSPLWSQLNGFETLLLRTTPLRHLEDTGHINLDEIDGQRFRQRTDFIFDSMTNLANMPGPKFVFIHIIPPHPPFVYAADGSWTDPAAFLNEDRLYTGATYTEGYRNQVAYINGQIEAALQILLDESPAPPIMIVQGDHAPWLQHDSGKFMILNAYYLPGHNDLLYPSISPVNTFRLVLDTYLGADYPLLEDVSYYSPTPKIYDFSVVPNPCSDR